MSLIPSKREPLKKIHSMWWRMTIARECFLASLVGTDYRRRFSVRFHFAAPSAENRDTKQLWHSQFSATLDTILTLTSALITIVVIVVIYARCWWRGGHCNGIVVAFVGCLTLFMFTGMTLPSSSSLNKKLKGLWFLRRTLLAVSPWMNHGR